MSKLYGIDLGTTYSAISTLDELGNPVIIPNADGERITASCVHFPADDPELTVIGGEAKKALALEHDRVVQHVKRDMGDDVTYPIKGRDQNFTPTQISSLIIKKLVMGAAKIHGEVQGVVITVPANFSQEARSATMEAGRMAGVEVEHIINEPTAAALHFATAQSVTGTVMIYDLGGGTFDVTIAKVEDQEVECLATKGDRKLGGVDFDEALLKILEAGYKDGTGSDLLPAGDDSKRNQLLEQACTLKHTLSKRSKGRCQIVGPDGAHTVEVSREEFEEAISTYLAKIELCIEGVLAELDMEVGDINDILLVGGSTRLPAVNESLRKMFGKDPLTSVNPDEAVSLGAAIYAGLHIDQSQLNQAQKEQLNKVKLSEVTGMCFGTLALNPETREQFNSIIIKKNTPIPTESTKLFSTVVDGQEAIDCDVTESEHAEEDPQFVKIIWEGELSGLPAGRPKGQPVEVTYSYDSNQMMHCRFVDKESGLKKEVSLQPKGTKQKNKDDAATLDDFIIE